MKKNVFIVLIVVFLLILGGFGLYYLENYEEVCYTKVDNSKIEKISDSDMKYQYSLACYKDNGKSKNVKFKTSRELRNDAYLLLELRTFGVHSWKEVQFDELPNKVKNKY